MLYTISISNTNERETMNTNELATKAVTGDKTAQVIWASLSTADILRMMKADLENGQLPWAKN